MKKQSEAAKSEVKVPTNAKHPLGPARKDLDQFLEHSFPLLAEDLLAARLKRRITSASAARQTGLDLAFYRSLEDGSAHKSLSNAGAIVQAAQQLGLKEIRADYVDVLQSHLKVDLTNPGRPPVIFIDSWQMDIREFRKEGLFVSPSNVFALVGQTGLGRVLDSTQSVDKQLAELWVGAILTLYLDLSFDYYVGLVDDDPPDVEVLAVDGAGAGLWEYGIEITRHEGHSTLETVILNKLQKKYSRGTNIVVLADRAGDISLWPLVDLLSENNQYDQSVYIVGGAQEPGHFIVIPICGPNLNPDLITARKVYAKNANKGYCGYEAVLSKSGTSRVLPKYPVFVRRLNLHK